MSLNSIFNIANSGLIAAQTQLRVVSDNVANVSTPGYIRKVAEQVSLANQGVGAGVDVARISLATDRFLQAASLNAGADAARYGVRYELYDRIQSLFGDPGGDSGLFSQIDDVFSSFASLSEAASSTPLRQEALYKAQSAFQEAKRIAGQIQSVREDADSRLGIAVQTANDLIKQIEALNVEITRSRSISGDATGAETQQSALIAQLGDLIDINVTPRGNGGVSIRTGSGLMLAGAGAATLSYRSAGAVNAESTFDDVWVTEPSGKTQSLTAGLKSGEIKGLLELRDVEAPAAAERLGELMSKLADELNRAHNANAAVPPPTSLTGRNIGQTLDSALSGFTGSTTIAVVNPTTGALVARADVTFPVTDAATFLADVNAQLGGAATISFSDGRLSLSTGTANGIAITDGATASNKAGRGFSHYFGLNDLVVTDRPSNYDLGLTASSLHGFTPGGTIRMAMTDANGALLRDVSVVVPTGTGRVDELLAALNSPTSGVGRYGSFVLDGTTGSISFVSSTQPATHLKVLSDTTNQVPSGVSVSELFGVGGGVRASRADGFSIRADIAADPKKLSLAQLNLAAAPGASVLGVGDGRGAALLANAGNRATSFQAAGGSSGGSMTLSRYASDLSGDIGARASTSKTRSQSASAIQTEAKARQTAHEGVNLDEELVAMTTYQQAFNASARLIQAAKDMYDTLLQMT